MSNVPRHPWKQDGNRIYVVFHCRYFTDSKPLCLGLGDLFETNTEETNLKSLLDTKTQIFFPGKIRGVGFSPQQLCFGMKPFKIKLEIEAADWLMISCNQNPLFGP